MAILTKCLTSACPTPAGYLALIKGDYRRYLLGKQATFSKVHGFTSLMSKHWHPVPSSNTEVER